MGFQTGVETFQNPQCFWAAILCSSGWGISQPKAKRREFPLPFFFLSRLLEIVIFTIFLLLEYNLLSFTMCFSLVVISKRYLGHWAGDLWGRRRVVMEATVPSDTASSWRDHFLMCHQLFSFSLVFLALLYFSLLKQKERRKALPLLLQTLSKQEKREGILVYFSGYFLWGNFITWTFFHYPCFLLPASIF